MNFFTSDTHFYHANVIKYSNRPYKNIDEMHEILIRNWNSVVSFKDIVYHLGDFTLTTKLDLIDDILEKLNGRIILIKGNHDKWADKAHKLQYANKFIDILDYKEIKLFSTSEAFKVVLMHYPMYTWNMSHYGSFQLHGHCHGSIDRSNSTIRRLDVGVDAEYSGYTPISESQIVSILTSYDRQFTFHHDDS